MQVVHGVDVPRLDPEAKLHERALVPQIQRSVVLHERTSRFQRMETRRNLKAVGHRVSFSTSCWKLAVCSAAGSSIHAP